MIDHGKLTHSLNMLNIQGQKLQNFDKKLPFSMIIH